MVRRFTPLFLAALALSVANPLSAAPPLAPPPREVMQQPKATAPTVIGLPFSQTYAPGAKPLLPSDIGPYPQYFPAPGVLTVGSKAAAGVPAAKAPARPVGVWVRDVGPVKIVLKLTDDRLTATAIFASGDEARPVVRITLDADYAVAKDGTLFGVVFGADADNPMHATVVRLLDGQPFAFGWRVDSDTLTVRSLKCLGAGLRPEATAEPADFDVFVNGRYTRIEEAKLPEWEKKLAAGADPLMSTVGAGLTAPSSKSAPSTPPLFRHVPGKCEAPSTLPAVSAPSVSIPAAPATTTTPPVVYADPAAAPQPLPVIAPPLDSRGATLPRRIAAPQPLPEVPTQAVPQSQPPTAAPSASLFGQPAPQLPASTLPHVPPSLLGTWTRDVGAFRATFKFTPKQLVVHMHVDPSAKKDFQELIFIVEYKLTADGKRFEGTVIGADVKTGKGVAFIDADDSLRGAREVDDQPMRFEFRITEGLLLVRNVSFGADGKSCALLKLNLPGVYALETEKTGPVIGQILPPPVVNSAVPREPAQNTHTTHVVEAPDILLIEVLKGVPKPAYQLEPLDVIRLQWADPAAMEPLQNSFVIHPDGMMNLGTKNGGWVKIAGLTVAEAKLAIEKSLAANKLKAPIITIDFVQTVVVEQQLRGSHLVRPDGTIGLGAYGSVRVAGKSLADAKRAVEKHLSQYLLDPEVSVEVQGFNNKTETPRGLVPIVPAPTSAKSVERPGCKVESSGPVPVLPPLREGTLPEAPTPPCIHEVLKALPPAPRGVPFIFEVSRENLEQTARVVKELEAEKLDLPRFYPLVGPARAHHATWKCTVTFTETITSDYPFPFKTTRARVEVVRVPQMSLYLYVGPEAPAVPPGEPTKPAPAPKCKSCDPSPKLPPAGTHPFR